jgi:hypothetical protein
MRARLFAPLRAKITSSAWSIGCLPQAEDQVCMENDSTATSALCEALHATGCIAFAERDIMERRL